MYYKFEKTFTAGPISQIGPAVYSIVSCVLALPTYLPFSLKLIAQFNSIHFPTISIFELRAKPIYMDKYGLLSVC